MSFALADFLLQQLNCSKFLIYSSWPRKSSGCVVNVRTARNHLKVLQHETPCQGEPERMKVDMAIFLE